MSQYFQVHPENPQSRLMSQAAAIILEGGVVIYPTDSGYAIGSLAGDKQALARIIRIRQLDPHHHLTLMCRDLSELSVYARVENSVFRLLRNNTPGPYTFILRGTKEVPRRLLNEKRKTIGLRVPDSPIALALLDAVGEPMLSGSLILPGNDFAESDPEVIRDKLEKQVDLIIDGGIVGEQPTTVVDLSDDEVVILRHGHGDVSPFQ
ncbi:L-threonylcarbamoyladenylate synthase [Celerinatantimonas yamalensis]|uniref:L-threonylcarbamoyladenylate synthase n=1 Tax=Celerinatantimonas yamalensis TaxID=559956 RepID=A0ABW9G2Z2_9GAMM